MSGIYVHIPFCKQACNYCDFHFSTSFKTKDDMLTAILKELSIRRDFLQTDIETVYFGGGSPSVVEPSFINSILDTIHTLFRVKSDAEITIEVNPDDIDSERAFSYKKSGINRVSVGIQSFDDKILKYLNRIHSSEKAFECLNNIKKAGFTNISIDLMYGIPNTDLISWAEELEIFKTLDVPHLSSYCMTIEPKTVFGNYLKNKRITPIDDETSIKQFDYLLDLAKSIGFDHYEISNFSKPGLYSKHNSAYWFEKPYLGIGPGAHSFDKSSRIYNVSNNNHYIYKVINNNDFFETETLTPENVFDEYIMTRMRTMWGCNIKDLKEHFLYDILQKPFFQEFVKLGLVSIINNNITLTRKGMYIADSIVLEIIYNR